MIRDPRSALLLPCVRNRGMHLNAEACMFNVRDLMVDFLLAGHPG